MLKTLWEVKNTGLQYKINMNNVRGLNYFWVVDYKSDFRFYLVSILFCMRAPKSLVIGIKKQRKPKI